MARPTCSASISESSTVRRVTNVATGVSGLTPTGPALSVAADGSAIAFTVYRNGRPRLTVLERNEVAEDERPMEGHYFVDVPVDEGPLNPAMGHVNRLLADHDTGLPVAEPSSTIAYQPRMALEGIGQPYLSSGGGPFGTFVRGGAAVVFGDMLGERKLGAAVQVSNRLRESAFALRYLNQERRWSWGGIAELEPGYARFRTSEAIEHDGEAAVLRHTDYVQRMQLRLAAIVAYPFSRGLRMEMYGGARQASYHSDQRSAITSASTGEIIDSAQLEARGGAPTTVGEVGAALVRDTTVLGPTGPLMGSRYRIEVAPAFGDLTYTTVMADVRRYLMPVRPFTLALRGIHAARYGPDGSDPRLFPSYLGSSYFVRGHHQDLRYCTPDETRSCGDELLGNRLLVGNVEVRFPLWGLLSRQIEYGLFPLDAFLFADGGIISRADGQRTAISAIGGGIRANAGGLPVEIGAVRAVDGPRPRWQFDVGFRVGF